MRGAQWLDNLRNYDLQALDPRHSGTWSATRKMAMAVVWAGLVLACGYMLLLQAPITRLQQHHKDQALLKTGFESRAAQVASLDAHTLQLHELEAAFSALLEQLPGRAQVPGMLDEISRLSQLNGLVIEHIQWLPEVPQPFYAELPWQLTLAGSYHELGLFVTALAASPRIVTQHDFTLAPLNATGDGRLRMTLLAKTYRTHDQGLIP